VSRLIEEVIEMFGLPETPKTNPIPKDKVVGWMGANDIEVLGAVYSYILDKAYSSRIHPPLSFNEYHSFLLRYYDRCLRENPDGQWACSRYSAGRDLMNWFKGLWKDASLPRSVLADIKSFLAKLYKEGDDELRTCIVNATLEHLFEERAIAGYFADWKQDPVLAEAYSDAMLWTQKG
jgi:hypothetical protein